MDSINIMMKNKQSGCNKPGSGPCRFLCSRCPFTVTFPLERRKLLHQRSQQEGHRGPQSQTQGQEEGHQRAGGLTVLTPHKPGAQTHTGTVSLVFTGTRTEANEPDTH